MFFNFLHKFCHLRRYAFYSLVTAPPILQTEYPPDLKSIEEEHFVTSPIFQEKGRSSKFITRLRDGHKCFGFTDNSGDVIAYFWVTQSLESADIVAPLTFGVNMFFPRDYIYIWDCRTHESHQKQGLYVAGLHALTLKFQDHMMLINAESNNPASIKGIEKAAFEYCSSLNALLLCRKWVLFWQKNKPETLLINPRKIDIAQYIKTPR